MVKILSTGEDTDSGMEDSSARDTEISCSDSNPYIGGTSDLTSASTTKGASEEFDDEPDETLAERLWGLTEMFPDSVRNITHSVAMNTKDSAVSLYGFSRSAFWIFFSTSIILFAPVIFEVERVQMEEAQRTQQKQMLLGPNAAVSGGGLPLMPPMHRS